MSEIRELLPTVQGNTRCPICFGWGAYALPAPGGEDIVLYYRCQRCSPQCPECGATECDRGTHAERQYQQTEQIFWMKMKERR